QPGEMSGACLPAPFQHIVAVMAFDRVPHAWTLVLEELRGRNCSRLRSARRWTRSVRVRTLNLKLHDRFRSSPSPDARSLSPTRSSPTTFHRPSPRHRAARAARGVRLPSASNGDSRRRTAANRPRPRIALSATRPRPRRAPKPNPWPKGAWNRMTEDTATAASPQSPAILHPQQQEMPLAVVHGQAVLQIPQDLYIPPDALEVILDAFEGPLDLLLYLIRRQNLDILDIPVAEITRQYVDYIGVMQELRFELAAEYLVMAAILAEIK